MNDDGPNDPIHPERRNVLRTAGAALIAGMAASGTAPASAQGTAGYASAAPGNKSPLGACLQGVQHFGLTVQNMDRAYEFYTEVLGGTEIMRDGDFQGERDPQHAAD